MTATSTFGVSRRESHDASDFYSRALSPATFSPDTSVDAVPSSAVDQIFQHTSEAMSELPDNSVAFMVTSPPYFVGKTYDLDGTFDEFLALLERVFCETHRVLQPGGRAAINIANLGRKPYVPLTAHVAAIMTSIGFHHRGEIIWRKAAGANGSCAWGSWRSPSNPVIRDLHEYVLVFSKGRMGRVVRGESTITKEAFMRDTLSIWDVRPESATSVGHPAPFPVELPQRLIELHTFRDEVVLDPFIGSGSTAIAARTTDRHFVGYELDAGYCDLARERLADLTPSVHARLQPHAGVR